MSKELCPVGTMYQDVNLSNHLAAIQYANYGPPEARDSNPQFWLLKQELWGVSEGQARMRVCASCHHVDRSPETQDCVIEGPVGDWSESQLPVTPAFVDVDGMPVWYCKRWNMTISPIRVCDQWESEDNGDDEVPEEDLDEQKGLVTKSGTTYKPTSGMASAARRALKWKKEGYSGGTRVGLARANQLANRENLTSSTVMRMHSFFSRHEVDKRATGFNSGEEGFPSPGRVAWDLWGGDGGQTWAKQKRDQIVREREG
jgi:hypothetical protein